MFRLPTEAVVGSDLSVGIEQGTHERTERWINSLPNRRDVTDIAEPVDFAYTNTQGYCRLFAVIGLGQAVASTERAAGRLEQNKMPKSPAVDMFFVGFLVAIEGDSTSCWLSSRESVGRFEIRPLFGDEFDWMYCRYGLRRHRTSGKRGWPVG